MKKILSILILVLVLGLIAFKPTTPQYKGMVNFEVEAEQQDITITPIYTEAEQWKKGRGYLGTWLDEENIIVSCYFTKEDFLKIYKLNI